MNKKTIEQYIQFAIDNGYESENKIVKIDMEYIPLKNYSFELGSKEKGPFGEVHKHYNLVAEITSKDFIEAIARGILGKTYNIVLGNIRTQTDLLNKITQKQAIAIRDGKLEDFIINLLGLGQNTKN